MRQLDSFLAAELWSMYESRREEKKRREERGEGKRGEGMLSILLFILMKRG